MALLNITPQTKIGEMLEAYPALEDTLLKLSPSFAKLKNPILRKTIARVVSLRQAAEVGKVDLGTMVAELRKAAGLNRDTESGDLAKADAESISLNLPEPFWLMDYDLSQAIVFDARSVIEEGGSPLNEILSRVKRLGEGEVMLLLTPFVPVPVIELVLSKGYLSWSKQEGETIQTFFRKK